MHAGAATALPSLHSTGPLTQCPLLYRRAMLLQGPMRRTDTSALAESDPWWLKTANWLFGPIPGSQAHTDLFLNTVRLRQEELQKPEGRRDDAHLLELTKQKLRLEAQRYHVRAWSCFPRAGGAAGRPPRQRRAEAPAAPHCLQALPPFTESFRSACNLRVLFLYPGIWRAHVS